MGTIDVKVHLPKTRGHTTPTFQNYKLENKLLQELSDEMFIITLNTFQSNILKSVLLLNSSGRISINWNFSPPLYRNPLLFIIYIDIKQGLNS